MRIVPLVFVVVLIVISISSAYAGYAGDNSKEAKNIEFCGALEGEFGYNLLDDYQNSDFALAKAELGANISLGPSVAGKILLLYEQGENDDKVIVDEGIISLKLPFTLPIELSLGRMIIPFCEFDSHFVTDSFALEISEKSHVGLMASSSFKDIADLSFALYNDQMISNKDNDHISDIASRLSFHLPKGNLGLSFGGSFITNISGTDGIADIIGDSAPLERAMGLGGFASLSMMDAFLELNYVTALKDIKLENKNTIKPQSLNIELGYSIPNTPIELAGKFETYSQENNNSVNRFGGVISFGLFNNMASLALEFLRTSEKDSSENSFTGQLSISF